jgi:MSHA pilin protein MshB
MKLNNIKQKGFTMIELVIVIAILGILAAFALPRFANFSQESQISAANSIASSLHVAVNLAKTKYETNLALGKTGTTVDFDDNPATTDDIVQINTLTKNLVGPNSDAGCQTTINALLPNRNDLTVTYQAIGNCIIKSNSSSGYTIIFKPAGSTQAGALNPLTTITYS